LLTQAVDIGTLVYNPDTDNNNYTIYVVPGRDTDMYKLEVTPSIKIPKKTISKIKELIKPTTDPTDPIEVL
jgi:hypothetical protein